MNDIIKTEYTYTNTMAQQPSITSTCPDEVKVALWAIGIKKQYWEGTLEQSKIHVLNNTEGWTWCPIEGETWEMIGFPKKRRE